MSREAKDQPKPAGLGEFLFNELRQAIQDIRQKVLEQGWFGRVTTPKPVVEMPFETVGDRSTDASSPAQSHRPSFEEQWATREPAKMTREAPSHEIELDR